MVHTYASPKVGLIEQICAIRSSVMLVRNTRYNAVVDEHVLTSIFRFVPPPRRLIVVVVHRGQMRVLGPRPLVVREGQAALLSGVDMSWARFEHASYLDIEGLPTSAGAEETPRLLPAPKLGRVRRLEAALDSSEAPPAETLAEGSALARALGAPLPALSVEQFAAPTPRDLAIAQAMVQQFALLSTEATATSLADAVSRSPRQLQRIVHDFNRRYGLNAGNWRDTRNRWRLQTATLLLSVPSLSIAEIAAEVGYRSPGALARAFAKVGFPAPAELRLELLGRDVR
jgi:AraC-like DNA-binding protein